MIKLNKIICVSTILILIFIEIKTDLPFKENSRGYAQECMYQRNATEADLLEFVTKYNHPELLPYGSHCINACWLKKYKILDDHNKIVIDNFVSLIYLLEEITFLKINKNNVEGDVKIMKDIAVDCDKKDTDEEDDCEITKNFMTCFFLTVREKLKQD